MYDWSSAKMNSMFGRRGGSAAAAGRANAAATAASASRVVMAGRGSGNGRAPPRAIIPHHAPRTPARNRFAHCCRGPVHWHRCPPSSLPAVMSNPLSHRLTRRTALKTGAALAVTAGLPLAAAAQEPQRQVWEGYTDQLSYAPGDEVKLHVSSSVPKLRFDVVRWPGGKPPYPAQGEFAAATHPIPKDASSHGCRWPVAATFRLPADTRSGYYSVVCEEPGANAGLAAAFFVVRPKEPGKDTKILLQVATNTYNAYTNWGGYSLYAYHGRHKVQGRRVSFDRPISSQFSRWEEPFAKWAEANGYTLDFCVNSDLEFHPELLKYYKLVLSVGHD